MLLGLLTIAFVVLKLMHYIDWSWWLVLSPVIIAYSIPVLMFAWFILFSGVLAVVAILKSIFEKG